MAYIECPGEGFIIKQNKNPCAGEVYILVAKSPIWASSVSLCGSSASSLGLNSKARHLACLCYLHLWTQNEFVFCSLSL